MFICQSCQKQTKSPASDGGCRKCGSSRLNFICPVHGQVASYLSIEHKGH